MADAEIVFTTPDGDLLALLPDAVISENPRIGADATEHEVEEGVAVTDHVRERADEVTLEAVFSNSPIRTIQGEDGQFWLGVEGSVRELSLDGTRGPTLERLAEVGPPARGIELGEAQFSVPNVQAFQVDGEEITRVQDSWSMLKAAKSGAWLAVIVTQLDTYRDMVLISAETMRTAKDGSWIIVPLIFKKLRQVETQLVDARAPLRPRNQAPTNQGAQPDDDATGDDDAERASLLIQAFG